MRIVVLVMILLLGATFSVPVMAQDATGDDAAQVTPETLADQAEREEWAEKVLAVLPFKEQVDSVLNEMSMRLPIEKRERFIQVMKEGIDIKTINAASKQALIDIFSARELEVMYNYYSQPEYDTINEKLNVFYRRIQPVAVEVVNRAALDLREKLK